MSWSDIWSGITETAGDIGKFGKDLFNFGSGDYFGNLKSDVGDIFSLQGTPSVPSTPTSFSTTPTVPSSTGALTEFGAEPTPSAAGSSAGISPYIAAPGTQPASTLDVLGMGGPAGTTTPPSQTPNFVQSAMNWISQNPMPALMLGMAGMNALRGPQTSTAEKTIANALRQQTQIPSQVAQTAMQQYNTGQLNAADQYALQQWKDQQTAQLNDYMARAGISDSSSHAQMLNEINTQALAQAEKMRQQYLANALSASGTSGQIGANLTNALATIQASGDQQAAQALQNMLISMGSIKR